MARGAEPRDSYACNPSIQGTRAPAANQARRAWTSRNAQIQHSQTRVPSKHHRPTSGHHRARTATIETPSFRGSQNRATIKTPSFWQWKNRPRRKQKPATIKTAKNLEFLHTQPLKRWCFNGCGFQVSGKSIFPLPDRWCFDGRSILAPWDRWSAKFVTQFRCSVGPSPAATRNPKICRRPPLQTPSKLADARRRESFC